jgi:hypothetical protein
MNTKQCRCLLIVKQLFELLFRLCACCHCRHRVKRLPWVSTCSRVSCPFSLAQLFKPSSFLKRDASGICWVGEACLVAPARSSLGAFDRHYLVACFCQTAFVSPVT